MHLFCVYFAKNIVYTIKLDRFWNLTNISVLAPKTETQLVARQSPILLCVKCF